MCSCQLDIALLLTGAIVCNKHIWSKFIALAELVYIKEQVSQQYLRTWVCLCMMVMMTCMYVTAASTVKYLR